MQFCTVLYSFVLPWRAILKELILGISLAAGAVFSWIDQTLIGIYTGQYQPSFAGPIWAIILPVELGLYGKILLS